MPERNGGGVGGGGVYFVPYIHKLCLTPGPQAQDHTSATVPKVRAIHLSEIIFFFQSTESSGFSLARESMLTVSYAQT